MIIYIGGFSLFLKHKNYAMPNRVGDDGKEAELIIFLL
jgi:hypothetical protein